MSGESEMAAGSAGEECSGIREVGSDRETIIYRHFCDHYQDLVGLAIVMMGDSAQAEEIVQDAFVQLWKHWSEVESPSSCPAYLRSTVVNTARSKVRRRGIFHRKMSLLARQDTDSDKTEQIHVMRLVRRLPPRQRACIALRFYQGYSVEETASTLNVALGTVKSQTHKALAKLAEFLEED